MQVFLSEDRTTVVTVEGETEVQHTIEEFVEIYGEDALPKEIANKEVKKDSSAIESKTETALDEADKEKKMYLRIFLEYLDANASYLHLAKLRQNVADGVYPAQVVAYDYGHIGKFEQELDDRDKRRWRKLRTLNSASQCAGYLPMSEDGMQKVMKFFENTDRRRYCRDNIRKMIERGECASIADLMTKRYEVEKKNRERSKKTAQ